MNQLRFSLALCALVVVPCGVSATPPVAAYIFPAGGQRGTAVEVCVGGLYLHEKCGFSVDGPGVSASPSLERCETLWFEGPRLAMPASQRKEDYPKDMAGTVRLSGDAPLGMRYWRVSTSQGITSAKKFVVGSLPEIVEDEREGEPVAVGVKLPVTINGRIFPREDVDVWSFRAKKGQPVTCSVRASKIGSPLDARLEVLGPDGKRLADNDDGMSADPVVRFTAPVEGEYRVRIHDIAFGGGQAYVYRLTVTSGPNVERIFPLGGRRGTKLKATLRGQAVPGNAEIGLPDVVGEAWVSVGVEQGKTNRILVDVGDVPEMVEEKLMGQGDAVELPVCLNGRIDRPGDSDSWAFRASKGDKLNIGLKASVLGSPLNAMLTVADESGKVLLTSKQVGGDPSMTFSAKADGVYTLKVESLFRKEGSEAHAYRIYLRGEKPGFALRLEKDAVTLNRGSEVKVKVFCDRAGGFAEAVELSVAGLPKGVSASGDIPAKKPFGVLVLKAEKGVSIRVAHLKVVGSSTLAGEKVERLATFSMGLGEPALERLALGLGVPTPFQFKGDYTIKLIPRGTVYSRKYRLDRKDYTGPLTAMLSDGQVRHLQGARGEPLALDKDTKEFEYGVFLPPWMEMGRTARVQIMLVGIVRDPDGTEHVVSYTSGAQNDQLITVLEPGPLSIEPDRSSIRVTKGKALTLPVAVRRAKGLAGDAKVEVVLPRHVRGVSAEAIRVGDDKGAGTLRVQFDEKAGPFPIRATVRATVTTKNGPVVAESRVTFEE